MKTYIGIDPGSKGYITVDNDGEYEFYALSDYDIYELSDLFYDIAAKHPNRIAILEDVRAIHGSSSTATFSFGQNKGMLIALLCATRTPFELVLPQRWQKTVWSPSDIVKVGGKVDAKKTSAAAAKRLAPAVDFRRTERCRNIDDNKCDSFLMAQYARRKNL